MIMRPLGAQDILDLSDGGTAGAGARALAVLSRAMPDQPLARHRALGIGRRDAELMAIRSMTFGQRFELTPCCPHCGAITELSLTAAEIELTCEAVPELVEPQLLRIDEHAILLRPVSAGDLADLEQLNDPDHMRIALINRCVLAVDGTAGADAPETLIAPIEAALAKADPAAEITLELTCPDCGEAWSELFDPLTVLWSDIRSQTGRLLNDVAELARAYHWSERDILAMPHARRRFYLEAARQ
jgi:rRNA maturation protein Nop10